MAVCRAPCEPITHSEPEALCACPSPTPSSVHAMSVAEVRRALSYIRKSWEDQQVDGKRRPFYLSDPIAQAARAPAQSIEHFSLTFVLAHHTRRLAKPSADARDS